MRHRKIGRSFNRTNTHQKMMFRNLMSSLIEHETIRTTLGRAKEMRRFMEPLITLSKVDSVANRRLAFARLRSKEAVKKLFTIVGPHSKDRKGGYLRVLKCGFRHSDAAPMAIVELVDRGKFIAASQDTKETKKPKKKTKAKKERK